MNSLLSNLCLVAQQVFMLFLMMAVGFGCNRKRIIDETSVKGMTNLLLIVVTPCLIVHSFQRPYDASMLRGLVTAFIISLGVHALGIIAGLVFRGMDDASRRTLRFATIFSNAGFMGIPLEYAVLGTEGVFYGVVYVAVFNVISWSYGVVLMSGSWNAMRFSGVLRNPGILAIAMGLPLFLFSVTLPEVIATPVKMFADLNTPLAMVIIGYYLAEAKFKVAMKNAAAWGVVALRLLMIPGITLAALWGISQMAAMPPRMMTALVLASSAPVAAFTTIFAVKFGRNPELSVGLVAGSTLLSIFTMPPIAALAITLFQ